MVENITASVLSTCYGLLLKVEVYDMEKSAYRQFSGMIPLLAQGLAIISDVALDMNVKHRDDSLLISSFAVDFEGMIKLKMEVMQS